MELGSVFGLDEARGANAAARRDARLVRAIVRTGSRAKADTLVRAYYDEMPPEMSTITPMMMAVEGSSSPGAAR